MDVGVAIDPGRARGKKSKEKFPGGRDGVGATAFVAGGDLGTPEGYLLLFASNACLGPRGRAYCALKILRLSAFDAVHEGWELKTPGWREDLS